MARTPEEINRSIELLELELEAIEASIAAETARDASAERTVKLRSQEIELQQKQIDLAREQLQLLDRGSEEYNNLVESIREHTQALRDDQEALEEWRQSFEAGADKASAFGESIFGVTGYLDKFTKAIPQNVHELAGFAAKIQESVTSVHGLTSALDTVATKGIDIVVNKTIELAFAQDEARAAFQRSTGASEKYMASIVATERATFLQGVTTEDVTSATEDLFNTMSGFTTLNKLQREDTQKNTALLEKLGIATSTTATNMDLLTKSIGMNVGESNAFLRDITATAKELGVALKD